MKSVLNIYDPVKIREGVFFSKLIIDDNDLTIQTKKNPATINLEDKRVILDIDSENIDYINWVSDEVINQTSTHSERWFGKHIKPEECKIIYKNSLVNNEKLHCFYDENTLFYEKHNTVIQLEDIKDLNSGIALIKCGAIIFTKSSFFIRWELLQFKIKHPPKSENKLSGYSIRDLDEHDISFGIESKVLDICLF